MLNMLNMLDFLGEPEAVPHFLGNVKLSLPLSQTCSTFPWSVALFVSNLSTTQEKVRHGTFWSR